MPRKAKPDTRLDWRNPKMPVLRQYEVTNQFGDVVEVGTELVDPELVSEVARQDLAEAEQAELYGEELNPSWRNDPSYGWGNGRQRKGRRALR